MMNVEHPNTSIWTTEMREQMREMWAAGLTTAEIGRRLGRTKNAIVSIRRRLDLPERPSPIRNPPAVRHHVPRVKPVKRGPGRSEVKSTLALKPSQPEPQPVRWPSHKGGCQWHLRREGLTHIFCGGEIGPRGGSWCEAHRHRVYVPMKVANAA